MNSRRTFDEPGTEELRFRTLTDPRLINHHMRRAEQMRAEAMGEFLGAALLGIARLGRTAAASLAGWRRQRAARRSLMTYGGRRLDASGLCRSDSPAAGKEQPVARASG